MSYWTGDEWRWRLKAEAPSGGAHAEVPPEADKEVPNWKQRPSGLFLPDGVPDGGRRATTGFSRALEGKR